MLLLKATSTFIITFTNIIIMYVLSTLLIIDVIIIILSVASISLPLSSTPFDFITFVFVHEFAHEVHADRENGEDDAENGDHLPLIVRLLCDERSVNRLSVLILLEKHQEMV